MPPRSKSTVDGPDGVDAPCLPFPCALLSFFCASFFLLVPLSSCLCRLALSRPCEARPPLLTLVLSRPPFSALCRTPFLPTLLCSSPLLSFSVLFAIILFLFAPLTSWYVAATNLQILGRSSLALVSLLSLQCGDALCYDPVFFSIVSVWPDFAILD
jgi:hypothetical protein